MCKNEIFKVQKRKTNFIQNLRMKTISACLVHATETMILDSNPKNRGSHGKKSCLVQRI
jgi:hypothetical protein